MSSNPNLETLLQAIEVNDAGKVHSLIRQNPILAKETVPEPQYPPLWVAAVRGYPEIVELLIESGANVQEVRVDNDRTFGYSQDKCTILHWMGIKALPCLENHLKVGEILIKHGAVVDTDQLGVYETALDFSIASGNTRWTEFLLNNGASLNFHTIKMVFDRTPRVSRKDTLSVLINHAGLQNHLAERDTNLLRVFINSVGRTYDGAAETAKFILESTGVSVNEANSQGDLPLRLAVYNQNIELISFLISEGADVNRKNRRGEVALHVAAERENTKVVDLLLSNGADVNARTDHGWTPLHYACNNSDVETVRLLVKKGADVCAESQQGGTPFSLLKPGYLGKDPENQCGALMVKEFAKLVHENKSISVTDEESVQMVTADRKFFEKCSRDLVKLEKKKFHGELTYYFVLKLSKNIKKLVILARNEKFVNNFTSKLKRNIFKDDLMKLLEEAMKIRDELEATYSKLRDVFGDYLPEIVLRKLGDDLTIDDLPSE